MEQVTSDNERLRGDNDGLLRALYPAIKCIRGESDAEKNKATIHETIKPFAWTKRAF